MRPLFVLALLAGCGDPVRCIVPNEPNPNEHDYVIGPEDLLNVTVRNQPDLTGSPRVRPDGKITMALMGDVQAEGRTASQVARDIAAGLVKYLRIQPDVTVAVTEVNSYRYTVSGNVEHDGMFTHRSYVKVSEAVAEAGGLNRYGSPKITILRRDKRGERRIPVDLRAIQSGKCPGMDIYVLRGDQILVP